MLYREIIAVCSEIHTKHINTLCIQKVEFLIENPGGTYTKELKNFASSRKKLDLEQSTVKVENSLCVQLHPI
jgi:hypothetical protein